METEDINDDFDWSFTEKSEENHKRKKGKYKFCYQCSRALEDSEISYVNDGSRSIYWSPTRPVSLNSRDRWEILNLRSQIERPATIHVPYRELMKGKCECSRCTIDLDGHYSCDWPGDRPVPIPAREPRTALPKYKQKARARPDFAVVNESRLLEILKWDELRLVLPPEQFPTTQRGHVILANLRKIYRDTFEMKSRTEIVLDLSKTCSLLDDNDETMMDPNDREWIVVFTTKGNFGSCTVSRNYFIRKLIKQNLPLVEIQVSASDYEKERSKACFCSSSRTDIRHNRRSRQSHQKGANKHDPLSKKEIEHQ